MERRRWWPVRWWREPVLLVVGALVLLAGRAALFPDEVGPRASTRATHDLEGDAALATTAVTAVETASTVEVTSEAAPSDTAPGVADETAMLAEARTRIAAAKAWSRRWRGTLDVTVSRGSPPMPAGGVTVEVVGLLKHAAVTDAQGRAQLEVRSNMRVKLFAHAEGEVSQTAQVEVDDGDRTSLALRILPARSELALLVVDSAGAPIPTAWLRVEGAGPVRQLSADARGRIHAGELPEVRLDARIGAPGFRTASVDVVPGAAPAPDWTLDLERVVRLAGRLLVQGEPTPTLDAPPDLSVDGRQYHAGLDGRFEIDDLSELGGPVAVEVRARRNSRTWFGAARLPRPTSDATVDVELVAPGGVRGRVLRGGRPLEGIQVALRRAEGPSGSMGSRVAVSEGSFEIVDAPPGTFNLTVYADGLVLPCAEVPVEIRSGETAYVEVSLEGSCDLGGHVVTAESVPVPHAKVVLSWNGRGVGAVRADEAGRFVAAGLPPGDWTLEARAISQKGMVRRSVRLVAGETRTDVRLVPEPVGRLVVRLLDTAGQPIGAVRVEVTEEDQELGALLETDLEGKAQYLNLAGPQRVSLAGAHLPRLAARRGVRTVRCDPVDVVLRPGETTEVVLRVVDQP